MERLGTDSPLARRIVSSFLDFLDSVEPAAGVDLEGLDVVRECLQEVFELHKHPRDHSSQPELLVDLFRHGQKSRELNSNCESESRQSNEYNGTFKSEVGDHPVPRPSATSEHSERVEDPYAEGISKDELFGQFYAALDKINFFAVTPGGDEDHVQLTKATNFFEDAILDIEKSGNQIVNRKNLADAFKSRGNRAMQSKVFAEAIELYTCAIVLMESAIYYCNRAAAYTQLCKYNEATEDCKKSIAIDPNYAKAYSRQGLVYFALKKYREAVPLFLKALQLDPNNESARENIKVAYQKWREQHQAEDHNQDRFVLHQQHILTEPTGSIRIFPDLGRSAGPSSHVRADPSAPFDLAEFFSTFTMNGQSPQGGQSEIRIDGINLDFQHFHENLSSILGVNIFPPRTGQNDHNSRN